MKTITITVEYNGEGESWEEIKDDAKNNKIKNVFIGSKEFVNVVRCAECKWWDEESTFCLNIEGVYGNETTSDWFCADGKRKEKNDEE